MLISDAARVILLAVLAAIALEFVSFPLILILVIGLGAFDIVFQPAEAASIPRLVPKTQLSQAFAQNEARQYAASLAGPPLGGLLYGVGRAVPFLFDLITYAVSFCAIAAIRGPIDAQPETTTPGAGRAAWRAGGHAALIAATGSLALYAAVRLAGIDFQITPAGAAHGTDVTAAFVLVSIAVPLLLGTLLLRALSGRSSLVCAGVDGTRARHRHTWFVHRSTSAGRSSASSPKRMAHQAASEAISW